jgi:predicted amidohydrolase
MGSESRAGPKRKLALAQCAPRLGDVDANLNLHLGLAEQAADGGAQLCVFPELSLTGYFLKDLVPEVAMGLDDERLDPLRDLSRKLDLAIGLVLRSEDFRYYNAALHLSGGEVVHVHRKVYLPTYGMFDEKRYFAPGDRVHAFSAGGVKIGMLVCEDMWHLSMPYLHFAQGVSLLICLSSSPGRGVLAGDEAPGSVESWRLLNRTLAAYNNAYVAWCNRVGYEDGANFWGHSGVWGPDGGTVAETEEDEGLTFADIDVREVRRQREATPLLRDEQIDFTLRELQRIWDERTQTPY